MQTNETQQIATVISLAAVRDGRRFIALALADEDYLQTRASFALSGIDLTDVDAERAGRVIAGVLTVDQIRDEILRTLK